MIWETACGMRGCFDVRGCVSSMKIYAIYDCLCHAPVQTVESKVVKTVHWPAAW